MQQNKSAMQQNKIDSGLIWITGFSSAGKTTISRKVKGILNNKGYKTIFLDGDDLRAIFGDVWNYDRDSRIELAKIYFRLARHLVDQRNIVIISAIAMFDPVMQWINAHVANFIQVFVNVPAEIRKKRDMKTKRIFTNKELNDSYYDFPKAPDLTIDNLDTSSPSEAAERIVDYFINSRKENLDLGRTRHWNEYYAASQSFVTPSDFARVVNSKIPSGSTILEIGCGNGRDACFFNAEGHTVVGIDSSHEAIAYCCRRSQHELLTFFHGNAWQYRNAAPLKGFDVIYARFVFHAMPLEEEIATIKSASHLLRPDGLLFIECRSINDQLAREGEFLSHTERINGHYRRFIIMDELIQRLESNDFKILEAVEGNGFAVLNDDDPKVIRICCQKGQMAVK